MTCYTNTTTGATYAVDSYNYKDGNAVSWRGLDTDTLMMVNGLSPFWGGSKEWVKSSTNSVCDYLSPYATQHNEQMAGA